MTEHSIDKREIATSESKDCSIFGVSKKKWQTPNILEMDYTSTASGTGSVIDGPASES